MGPTEPMGPMGTTFEGRLDGRGLRVGVVVSRFNSSITRTLHDGARQRLMRLGVSEADIDTVWVSGAFELPQAVRALMNTERYDGVVALGCVIRGETPHFDYVCRSATDGLTQLAINRDVPLAYGLLTCDTPGQAQARAGLKSNKGAEAAESLVELIRALEQLKP